MITIPVAVANDRFRWQISFFEFQHKKIYGNETKNNCLVLIVKRNFREEKLINNIDWNINIPYSMVESIYDLYPNLNKKNYNPINVYTAVQQIINQLDNEEYIEIIDADMIHLKKFDLSLPNDDEIYVDDIYEKWHMFINSKNRYVIEKYLKHSDFQYMNGGWNSIGKVKTMKKLLPEIIDVSIDIATNSENELHKWWSGMFGLNVACHNQRIKMINHNSCYYPNINEIDLKKHHIAHYSCDPLFKKSDFPNIDFTKFKNNEFYNSIREWLIKK